MGSKCSDFFLSSYEQGMCMEMRGGQFTANTEVVEAWELEKEKLPVLPTLRVEGDMRSEERKDGFNLSHQPAVKCECNRARNGLLSKETLRGVERMSAGFLWTL